MDIVAALCHSDSLTPLAAVLHSDRRGAERARNALALFAEWDLAWLSELMLDSLSLAYADGPGPAMPLRLADRAPTPLRRGDSEDVPCPRQRHRGTCR